LVLFIRRVKKTPSLGGGLTGIAVGYDGLGLIEERKKEEG